MQTNTTESPNIDVVILSWNRTEKTIETINSVLTQEEVTPWIWLVDQGSDTPHLESMRVIASKHNNVHLEELGANIGVPGGRNRGMRLGYADVIVSIDNDAILESPYAFRDIIQHFESDPKLGVLSLRIKNFYTGEDDNLSWIYPKAQRSMREQSFLTTRFPGGAHALRREALKKTGEYDEIMFFYWEEVDLSYRFIIQGYHIRYDPGIAILHKISPEARVSWEKDRYYYTTRNAIYIKFKYEQNIIKAIIVGLGYLIKGIYNRVPSQALNGFRDGIRMCKTAWSEIRNGTYKLNQQARSYIWENEKRYRGSLWQRLKTEVFSNLPGRGNS
jgi:GT2 family glycosyltransferase